MAGGRTAPGKRPKPNDTPAARKRARKQRGPPPPPSPSPPPAAPLPPPAYPFHRPAADSGVTAQRAFQWLLGALPVADFFSVHFEKRPALLRAGPGGAGAGRFRCLLAVADVRRLVRRAERPLAYGADVDVTHYTEDGGRKTLNGDRGAAAGAEAWRKFERSRCSIRLLRPQEHVDSLWALCSMLETFFGAVVGANVYLTPPESQGFAPHFDDIDAFVCQVSGRKRWRVYGPRGDGADALPRRSSVDFTAEEMSGVPVVYDTVLEPGDLLYLPRGTIHQAECPSAPDADSESAGPSLHVTLSTGQQTTWADLLRETLAAAVESASHAAVGLRRSVPLRFTDYVGVGCADSSPSRRSAFDARLRKSLRTVAEAYPIDAAADAVAKRFMRERLPPWDVGVAASVAAAEGNARAGRVRCGGWVRAVGRGLARVVLDSAGELPAVVHCLGNGRGAGAGAGAGAGDGDGGRMTCTAEEAFAIDAVLKAYPAAVRVGDLPLDDREDRRELAEILAEVGIAQIV